MTESAGDVGQPRSEHRQVLLSGDGGTPAVPPRVTVFPIQNCVPARDGGGLSAGWGSPIVASWVGDVR